MTDEEQKPAGDIFKQLCLVQRDVGAVGKDGQNQQQGYRFRANDAFVNMLHSVLATHNVCVMPKVLKVTREVHKTNSGKNMNYTILEVEFGFTTIDGSAVFATTIGEGSDMGDKSCNKAMTAAYKYALQQVFSIPTDESAIVDHRMIDSEDDSPESTPQSNAAIEERDLQGEKQPACDSDPEPDLEVQPPKRKAQTVAKKTKIPQAKELRNVQDYPRSELIRLYKLAEAEGNAAGKDRVQKEGERRAEEEKAAGEAFKREDDNS